MPAARRAATRKRTSSSILVLQLDSTKLEADGLDLVPFTELVASIAPRAQMTIVRGTTLHELLRQLAELHGQKFDVISVIGHSNERGIVLGAGRQVDSWEAFAQYLKPFEPRRLALIACRAGRALPSRVLFSALPKLRRIFATPVLADRVQGQVMLALLPYILERKVPPRTALRTVQAGLALLRGRQLWEWRRTDFERNRDDPFAPLVEDMLADIGGHLLGQLRGRGA